MRHFETTYLFHRIIPAGTTTPMEMTVDRFASCVADIASYNRSWRGKIKPIGITFDDGYQDNLTLAAPVLADHKQSATFFITGSEHHHTEPFWWEQVPRLVASCTNKWLCLELPDRQLRIDVRTEGGRSRANRVLTKSLRHHSTSVIAHAMSALKEQAGNPELVCPARLSEDEIRELSSLAGMTIGGHTEHHELLAALSENDIESTVRKNLDWLEELCGVRPTLFAYPFGHRAAVSNMAVRVIQQLGIVNAYVNWPGRLVPSFDAYRLPRKIAV